jgi:serine protease SohB
VARLKAIQKDIHASFIDWVKGARRERLAEGVPLFEGDVWVGARAVEVGLADAVGEMRPVLKERFGEDIALKEHGGQKGGLLARLLGRSPSAGAEVAEAAVEALETRLAWGRYGL